MRRIQISSVFACGTAGVLHRGRAAGLFRGKLVRIIALRLQADRAVWFAPSLKDLASLLANGSLRTSRGRRQYRHDGTRSAPDGMTIGLIAIGTWA
jgi:hypothetical protein